MRSAVLERSPPVAAIPPRANGARPAEPLPLRILAAPGPDRVPDPYTARRDERTEWKLAHPQAWWSHVRSLLHYDPGYRYDVTHEYEDDWTTDPDYPGEIRRLPHNEDGVPDMSRQQNRHRELMTDGRDSLNQTLHTDRTDSSLVAVSEPILTFRDLPLTYPNVQARPDLAVVDTDTLPLDRDDALYHIHMEAGDPAPVLVVEITSPDSTRPWDLREKRALYAELGIPEYLVLDSPARDAPYVLRAFVLQADGRYGETVLGVDSDGVPNYHSAALGRPIRLQQLDAKQLERPGALDIPRLQWWDADTGRWRDRRTDGETVMAERDQAVAGRDQAVTERNEAVAGRDQAVAGRDQAVTERNEAVTERNEAVTERNEAVTERNEAVTERNEAVTERNEAVTERNEAVTERNEAEVRLLDASIGTLWALLGEPHPQVAAQVEDFWRTHGAPAGHRVAGLVLAVANGAHWQTLLRAVTENDDGVFAPDRALDLLRNALPVAAADRIAAHWGTAGPPAAAADRVLEAVARPREWQAILDISEDDNGPLDSNCVESQVPGIT